MTTPLDEFIGWMANQKETAVTPGSQSAQTPLERAKELRLKHLTHNQASHGFRFGKTPSLEQARRYRKAGVLNEYSKRARQRSGTKPAKERNAERPKVPKGNGRYGEDGTATDSQKAYAAKLKSDSLDREYDSFYGNVTPEDRANMVLEKLPRTKAIISRFPAEAKQEFARKLYGTAGSWLKSTDTQRMSKRGMSDFIDYMKGGRIVTMINSMADKSPRSIASFLNSVYGGNLFQVYTRNYDGELQEYVSI